MNTSLSSLRFETETGEYSYLSIHGSSCKVYMLPLKIRTFFIVIDDIDGQTIIVTYSRET